MQREKLIFFSLLQKSCNSDFTSFNLQNITRFFFVVDLFFSDFRKTEKKSFKRMSSQKFIWGGDGELKTLLTDIPL